LKLLVERSVFQSDSGQDVSALQSHSLTSTLKNARNMQVSVKIVGFVKKILSN
jgi:hypothetical protein